MMFKKTTVLFLTICMLIFGICACNVPTGKTDIKAVLKEQVEDFPVKCGNQIIQEEPKSIAVLDDNVADILIACGYADKIKAKSSECTQKEIQNVKAYGSNLKPKVAEISKLNADIVFVVPEIDKKIYTELQSENKIVLKMSPSDKFTDFAITYANICKTIEGNSKGETTGRRQAEKIVSELQKSESNAIVKGCFLYGLDGKSAVTSDMYENELLSLAGVQNIAAETDTNGHLDKAKIVAADKQEGFAFYIFCENGMGTKILSDKVLKTTNAVIKNRVIEVPKEYLTRQGVTAIKGLNYIISAIKSQNNLSQGADISADYAITLYEGISYTLGAEDGYVLAIQKRLDDLGYLSINQTGYFGESTAEAIKLFQTNNDLSHRDGIADEETLRKLFSTSAFANAQKVTKNTLPAPTEAETFSSVNVH